MSCTACVCSRLWQRQDKQIPRDAFVTEPRLAVTFTTQCLLARVRPSIIQCSTSADLSHRSLHVAEYILEAPNQLATLSPRVSHQDHDRTKL